jgi:hypothetical protein
MRVTDEERAVGALAETKLAELVATFEARGTFVLEGVVPRAVCAQLAPRMLADAAAICAHGGRDARGDFGHGHLQLGACRNAPFVHAEVVANPVVEQAVCAILRGNAQLGFYNGVPLPRWPGLCAGARALHHPRPSARWACNTRCRCCRQLRDAFVRHTEAAHGRRLDI